jgi:hypothetical protein
MSLCVLLGFLAVRPEVNTFFWQFKEIEMWINFFNYRFY